MRFSLRKITSGALMSISASVGLLRDDYATIEIVKIGRRETTTLDGTSGRSSGGITWMTFMTIHHGLFSPLALFLTNASMVRRRLKRILTLELWRSLREQRDEGRSKGLDIGTLQ